MNDFGEGLLAWGLLTHDFELLWFWFLLPGLCAMAGFAYGRATS
jgi:hypothetical protein